MGSSWYFENNEISLQEASGCPELENLVSGEVTVNFTIVNKEEEFIVAPPILRLDEYRDEYWEVLVNDEETEDFI